MRWLGVCDPGTWNKLKGCFIISLSYWVNLSKMEKRARPEPGFYNREQNVKLERKRRPQHHREVLPDLYTVERIVAKRKVGHSSEYLVQWQDYPADQRTWAPESHLPEAALTLFESPPMPPSEWVIEARERIAIVLEKELKTFRETDVTLVLSHSVLRHLFPLLLFLFPSVSVRQCSHKPSQRPFSLVDTVNDSWQPLLFECIAKS